MTANPPSNKRKLNMKYFILYLGLLTTNVASSKSSVGTPFTRWTAKEKTQYMRYCMENLQTHGRYPVERAYNRCLCITEHMSLNQPFKRAHLYHVIVSERFTCPP